MEGGWAGRRRWAIVRSGRRRRPAGGRRRVRRRRQLSAEFPARVEAPVRAISATTRRRAGGATGDLPDFRLNGAMSSRTTLPSSTRGNRAARELRREARRAGSDASDSPPARTRRHVGGTPLVIMAVAVLTTLLSLFVVTWDRRRPATASGRPPAPRRRRPDRRRPGRASASPTPSAPRSGSAHVLPAIAAAGATAATAAGSSRDLAAAAPAGVTVVPVGRTVPS